MTPPFKCVLCGKPPKLDDEGAFLEECYWYQRIDGKLQLAKDIVLHKLMYLAHAECPKVG